MQPAVTKFGGDVRLYRKNANGSLTPVIPEPTDPSGNQPVEANAMVFSREEGEKIEIKSKRRGTRFNQPIYSEEEPGTASMSLTLLEVPPMIFARVLYGQAADEVAVASGAVTDAALAVTSKDRPLQLPHRMLKASPAPVVMDGVATLVAGTDYTIDLRRGQVMILSAGVAVGDTGITISYSYDAYTHIVISGGGTPTEKFYVTGDMENRASGASGELEVYEWNASVDGEVDLFGSEPISPVLSGPLIIPSDKETPYTFTAYQAA